MSDEPARERSENSSAPALSAADKYFVEQRDLVLQDINNTMDSILNNLNSLNISLENSIAVGKEFESVAELWKTFYNGLEGTETLSSADDEEVK
ncbi:DAD1 (YDR016C) [Zygosaccharomyces parabailii]|uniref:DASH complex subunit DAD1 n=1 Tax=Zygosaccharomyces bailii (strain CLIB 213 / ATCC 58445 / CBS 680 / BCRC 21525 / NBRC 1098 / NCYC 1416 / NRRL Y-2227) TaxID=1333698 RepID=A0A8J2WYM2_ZYGB2|nr:DAD1 (YDR016C) [Zygosaccharomyces parabailii]CDF89060.1 ZYBA0S03-08218g1_1 [Zygosaccharomyces bailii CLIB 213]SJM83251.1 related to DASH complex subunit DAD1 [Zygosaccharomyces bailii]